MNAKILVADDSQTIQKVIKITLSAGAYQLVECTNEKELWAQLDADKFDLILFDFNLSSEKSGYELGKELRVKASDCAIMAMLGTFDTVDENALREAGVTDKIVKPFESAKFIEKCQELIERGVEGNAHDESVVDDLTSDTDIGPQEEILDDDLGPLDSGTIPMLEAEDPEISTETIEEAGFQEMKKPPGVMRSTWEMDVPGIIDRDDDNQMGEIPGVINDDIELDLLSSAEEVEQEKVESDGEFDLDATSTFNLNELTESPASPSDEDLEYPQPASSARDVSELLAEATVHPKSKLVSLDDLAQEEDSNDEDDTDPEFQIPDGFSTELQDEIQKDVSPDDFWAVDETQIMEEKQTSPAAPSADMEELKKVLTPIIEQMVKEYCQTAIEKVAWEVIPDLAENLIKKELKEISQEISD